jgi:hypothetical protein
MCYVPATANYAIMLSQNHFHELNWHVLTFLDPIFTMQDHILSTTGDALSYGSIWFVVGGKILHVILSTLEA